MSAGPDLRRHDLFDVAPGAFAAILAARPDLAGVPHVAEWAAAGRPVIVRRRLPGEAQALLPAGLPLPPAAGKRRIGLAVPYAAATPRPGLTLAAARGAAPSPWQPTIDAVLALAARHGFVPRVFGGLLWQALTGLAYLGATSDLDLLWPEAACGRGFREALAAIDAAAPMRLDGEIVRADGAGVSWRELHATPPGGSVLAKRLDGVGLVAVPD